NSTYSALLASLPQNFLQQINLPSNWASQLQNAVVDLDGNGYPDTLDLSNATVTSEITGSRWRINLKNGHKLFVLRNTEGTDADTSDDVLNVRSESRTFDLQPQSFALEILGSMQVRLPPQSSSATTYATLVGGFFIRIQPTRLEVFATARAEIPIL